MKLLALALLLSPQDDVKSLVEKLADDNLEQRDEAAAALVKLGPAALPRLRAITLDDKEAAGRLATVIVTIERNERIDRAFARGTRVSLDAKDRTVRDVLAQLSKESGIAIACPALRDEHVTAAFDKLTFWEALDRVCRAHSRVMWDVGDESIIVEPRSYVDVPKVFRGPYMVYLKEMRFTRRCSAGPRDATAVTGYVAFERGAAPNKVDLVVDEFKDDKGASLLPPPRPGGGMMVISARYADRPTPPLRLPVTFYSQQGPDEAATKIATFRGAVEVSVPTQTEVAAFKEPAQGAERKAGPLSVTLQSWKRDGRAIACRVRVRGAPPPVMRPSMIALVDGTGTAHPGRSADHYSMLMREEPADENLRDVDAVWVLPEGAEPAELRVSLVTEVHVERVPFSLTDLPLGDR